MGDVSALTGRIKALEEENARLVAQLSLKDKQPLKALQELEQVKKARKRFIALKIMYIGSNYHGFASQGCALRTVESELFAALNKTKLVIGPISQANYSRCGRTDKGVSAAAQVVALYLRSRKDGADETGKCIDSSNDRVSIARASRHTEDSFAGLTDDDEIDYVSALNRALPADIRVLGWCPVPAGFHARFSCLYREYKYFFVNEGLNINAMKEASQKLLGEHDFRNFCKMDADNIHNYVRQILAFDILPTGESWGEKHVWVIRVRGNAFLWHQVRCMAAVLFMIGQGHEKPSIIDELLDIYKIARKPQYLMASELPLVLQTCAFQGLRFYCRADAKAQIQRHLLKQLNQTLLSAALISEGIQQLDCGPSCACKAPHVPLLSRPTEPTYDERRSKSTNSVNILCAARVVRGVGEKNFDPL